MLNATKKKIHNAVENYKIDHNINTNNIKGANPFPVSPRWLDDLRHSVENDTDKSFQKNKVIALCKFLELPFTLDGSIVKIGKSTKTGKPRKKCKKSS